MNSPNLDQRTVPSLDQWKECFNWLGVTLPENINSPMKVHMAIRDGSALKWRKMGKIKLRAFRALLGCEQIEG